MTISKQSVLVGRWLSVAVIVVCATTFTVPARSSGLIPVNLSGRVIGGSGKHVVFVALWDSSGFLKAPSPANPH